jgi:hypothetical protein
MDDPKKNMGPDQRWVGGLNGLKEKYLDLISTVDRDGIEDLIKYLEESDFFNAPASAKNHNCYRGGLVEHSIAVCNQINILSDVYLNSPDYESLTLISLCHDLCKINFYKETTRNVKINGEWRKEPYFTIEDSFPYGHGEKSVLILSRFVNLSTDEQMAIRWHMAGWDASAGSYEGGLALRNAAERYPLVILLHIADLASVYLEVK